MTTNEFEATRLVMLWYSSDFGDKIVKKIRINTEWKNDYFKLYCLNRYIDIMIEYTPQSEEDYDDGDGNTNFFSVEDMLFIQEKMNEICNTDWAMDFYLTT